MQIMIQFQKENTMFKTQLTLLVLFAFNFVGFAANPSPAPASRCEQIVTLCKNSGFVAGEWKEGIGLYAHCVAPLMSGQKEAKGAKKPLPKVDKKLIEACRKEKPDFGAASK